MKTQILTTEFKNMLKVMDKIKDKDSAQITDLLVISKDNTSQFIKSNLETTIIYTVPSCIEEPGTITLPLESAELIKKLKEASFILTNDKIKTKKKEISFTEKDLIKINTYENIEKIFSVTQKELLRMLEVTYAVAQDETRPILTGVCFDKNNTCCLDGYRMSVRISTEYENDKTFVVNQFSINILKSVLKDTEDIVKVYYDINDTVKFEVNNIVIIAKCLEGEFIKYKQIIPQEYKIKSTLNPEELLEEIDFIRSADKRNFLKTVFTEDKIILKANQCKQVYDYDKSCKDQEKRQKSLTQEYREKHLIWEQKKNHAVLEGKQFKTKEPVCKQAKFVKKYDLVPMNDIISNIDAKNELNNENEFVIAYNPNYMNDALKQYKSAIDFRMSNSVSPIVVTDNIDKGLELVLPVRLPN